MEKEVEESKELISKSVIDPGSKSVIFQTADLMKDEPRKSDLATCKKLDFVPKQDSTKTSSASTCKIEREPLEKIIWYLFLYEWSR